MFWSASTFQHHSSVKDKHKSQVLALDTCSICTTFKNTVGQFYLTKKCTCQFLSRIFGSSSEIFCTDCSFCFIVLTCFILHIFCSKAYLKSTMLTNVPIVMFICNNTETLSLC